MKGDELVPSLSTQSHRQSDTQTHRRWWIGAFPFNACCVFVCRFVYVTVSVSVFVALSVCLFLCLFVWESTFIHTHKHVHTRKLAHSHWPHTHWSHTHAHLPIGRLHCARQGSQEQEEGVRGRAARAWRPTHTPICGRRGHKGDGGSTHCCWQRRQRSRIGRVQLSTPYVPVRYHRNILIFYSKFGNGLTFQNFYKRQELPF